MKILLKIILIIVILLGIVFLYQTKINQGDNNEEITKQERLLYDFLLKFHNDLDSISGTLDLYNNDFNETENRLFFNAIEKDISSLNSNGKNISYVWPMEERHSQIYEDKIWKIENLLNKIIKGSINDEYIIYKISTIIKDHNNKLYSIFYGEKGLGIMGTTSEEVLSEITQIIDSINNDIKQELESY
ncbi:hypothetical protein [Tenuibacillus multivorans]|uniref:Uncharacterized protein n=1 Tax=Tenuibacillus multivorans TaxID=237069 RepID=A0A1G9ZPG1_9BACI|nr:hypothetical protein [Tenuibacillus multivorans]GEL76789.1 hypothetical protein TMU01_10240 [Tenuibacillus multivorans]SDN22967.1 hypothetical protein SAMN05216498_1783 [Tenuibacillus multivorans]